MTLSFAQQLNGKPTYFTEKIIGAFQNLQVNEYTSSYIRSEYYKSVRGIDLQKNQLEAFKISKDLI